MSDHRLNPWSWEGAVNLAILMWAIDGRKRRVFRHPLLGWMLEATPRG